MRYGNKSVISEIREDEDMPFTEDGRRVDLLLNLLALINRTTSFPMYEIISTSIAYKVRNRMKELTTYNEKEELLFDFIKQYNEVEYERMWKLYCDMSADEKKDFIDDAIETGIYLHQPPLWETKPIFHRIQGILQKYDWLKPDNVYINKWGRKMKILNNYWIGDMYVLKLKQTDRKGFIVRSTGAIDTKGLPTKSYKSRSHLEQYSGNAIRFGEFETLNFTIGILPDDIALFNAMYRTSIKGRKDLVKLLFQPSDGDSIQKIDSSYTSRVAEIFNVYLKSLSIDLEFVDEDNVIYSYDDTTLTNHELNGVEYFCTDYQFLLIKRRAEIREEILSENAMLAEEELEKMIDEELKRRDYLTGSID